MVGVIYVYVDTVFGWGFFVLFLFVCLFVCFFSCVLACFSMLVWSPAVLSVL